jgi:dihydroxyacid dehydratase/phosphogluconate dehydratase
MSIAFFSGPRASRWLHVTCDPRASAVAATGGSTNAGLHLPAIAHEAGIRFTLDDVAEVFQRTLLIANLQPGGEYLARDLHYAGGVAAVLKPCSTAAISTARRSR